MTSLILDSLISDYGSLTSIQTFDFYIIISTLRALLKDPEMLELDRLDDIMNLFSKCSNIEDYKAISLTAFALDLYFETAERILGKIYFERKLLKVENSKMRFPGMNIQEIMAAEKLVVLQLGEYGEQAHDNILQFSQQIFSRLDITTNSFTYIGDLAIEIKIQTGYPPDFEGNDFYIKESDIYWEIPYGLFDAHQNVASRVQQIYLIGIKWLANPFVANDDQFAQLGTNATAFSVYDNSGRELSIQNLTTPISIYMPYTKNTGYSKEFLQCQYYDRSVNKFLKDGCGKSFLDSRTLPCTTCAIDNSYTVTDVLKCRCSHLSTIGGVFSINSVSERNDPRQGICLKYFALNYWRESFGYYLCWPAMVVYLIGLSIAIVFDCITIPKMRAKIIKRITLVSELNKLYKIELEEQRQIKKEEEKRLIASPPEGATRDDMDKKKRMSMSKDKKGHLSDDDKDDLDFETLDDTKKAPARKIKGKKKILFASNKATKKNDESSFNNFLVPDLNDVESKSAKSEGKGSNGMIEEDKNIEVDDTGLVLNGSITKNGKKKLLKKKKPIIKGSLVNQNKESKDIKNSDKVDAANPQENGNSNGKGDSSKNSKSKKKTKKSDHSSESMSDQSEEEKEEIINTEDKYKFPTSVNIFEHHRGLYTMMAYTNPLINVLFVTSYLCPRHVRASMMMTNAILIWFMVAVYFNNTRNPLVVPDFNKSAKNLSTDEIILGLIVPIFTMNLSYIFWGIFRVKDHRFHQPDAYEKIKDGTLMKSLLKEMYLRFVMAYFIMVAIFGAVMWYIVTFTATFGWKVSWEWWFSGCFAYFINYFVYDPIITWFHYTVYGCSEVMWRKIMSWRSLKIGCPEVLDDLYIPPLTERVKDYLKKKKLYIEAKSKLPDEEYNIKAANKSDANSQFNDDMSVTNTEMTTSKHGFYPGNK